MATNQTSISLLRKGGKGIKGTVANAEHHAEHILPIIEAMQGAVKHLGFKSWKQGNNIHQFETHDGRAFTLRPIVQQEDPNQPFYCGIRLALRESRSVEHWLVDITDVWEVPQLLVMMEMLARPKKGRLNTGAERKEAA